MEPTRVPPHTVPFWLDDTVKTTIARLKTFEPPNGYYLAFSGGKDSVCLKRLADMAEVKYDAHYSVTTIDPPELMRFIKQHYPDVAWDRAPVSFWKMMETEGFPMRTARWCCKEFKERGGAGRVVLTGVRAAESAPRADRQMVEPCQKGRSKHFVHPMLDWTDDDVWAFIHREKLPYCSLYNEGFKRIGCMLCPMQYDRQRDIRRWPRHAEMFRRALRRYYSRKKAEGNPCVDRWPNADAMFDWWVAIKPEGEEADCPLFQ